MFILFYIKSQDFYVYFVLGVLTLLILLSLLESTRVLLQTFWRLLSNPDKPENGC